MIKFYEHDQTGYALRTWENAKRADMTIAFAIDFTTPGEILTRKASYGKYRSLLVGVHLTLKELDNFIDKIASEMNEKGYQKLNIAGNGLPTLIKFGYDQAYAYDIVSYFLKELKYKVFNFSVRTGGQRGFDEAALLAADYFDLETICLAPKHWLFRDETGADIMSESLFLKRFGYDVIDLL